MYERTLIQMSASMSILIVFFFFLLVCSGPARRRSAISTCNLNCAATALPLLLIAHCCCLCIGMLVFFFFFLLLGAAPGHLTRWAKNWQLHFTSIHTSVRIYICNTHACKVTYMYTHVCVCAYLCFFSVWVWKEKNDNNNNNSSNNRRTVMWRRFAVDSRSVCILFLPTFVSRNLFKDNGQINMYVCV